MNRPEALFLSHCVPWPPDKGEKIRAWNTLQATTQTHQVHLACLAANESEMQTAGVLKQHCASVTVELRRPLPDLFRASALFLLGQRCLNEEYYAHPKLRAAVLELARQRDLAAAMVSTVVMAPYVPAGLGFVMDMIDVDSEKWLQYAETRTPAALFRLEAKRLREREILWGKRAAMNFFTTRAEADLFLRFAGDATAGVIENGVDAGYFNPAAVAPDPQLSRRSYITFVGSMDYYPNAQAVIWLAREVLPALRTALPGLEFLIVGRSPGRAVRQLAALPGVEVTGGVADVRPYLKHSRAQVAPLGIARGVQNKVLEALSMGTRVLASTAVGRTLGPQLPPGVTVCSTAEEYAQALEAPAPDSAAVRQAATARFQWGPNLEALTGALASVTRP